MSGLRINLFKSSLVGINLDPFFVQAETSFLNCEIDKSSSFLVFSPVSILEEKRFGCWLCPK